MGLNWDSVIKIVTSAGAVVGLLIGILTLFSITRKFLWSLWQRLKPALRVIVAAASLILPNALIVGLIMHQVAIYYFEAGSLDLIVTNSTLFLSLVSTQACLVSLYSFLWGIFVYPKLRRKNGPKAEVAVSIND
jgi:hypothetical protein